MSKVSQEVLESLCDIDDLVQEIRSQEGDLLELDKQTQLCTVLQEDQQKESIETLVASINILSLGWQSQSRR